MVISKYVITRLFTIQFPLFFNNDCIAGLILSFVPPTYIYIYIPPASSSFCVTQTLFSYFVPPFLIAAHLFFFLVICCRPLRNFSSMPLVDHHQFLQILCFFLSDSHSLLLRHQNCLLCIPPLHSDSRSLHIFLLHLP